MSSNLPYDPVRDFTPISMAVEATFFVTVRADSGLDSVGDLVERARKNPGKLSYSSFGPGSVTQLLGEQFKQLAGVDILHVPYKGGAPAQQALVAGEVSLSFGGSSMQPLVQSGRLKHLAVLDEKRSPNFPDVPSIRDTLPNYTKIGVWSGFFGPRGLPAPMVARLNMEIVRALREPKIESRLTSMGVQVIADSPGQFREKLARDIALVEKVIKDADKRKIFAENTRKLLRLAM